MSKWYQVQVPNRYRVYSVPILVPTFEDFRYRYFPYRFGTEWVPCSSLAIQTHQINMFKI
ncbi:hypothetical protein Hanom_Chr02g00147771 [Helianthus anomalus]